MSDIIIPGAHGIGTVGFTPTASGYGKAADSLIALRAQGCLGNHPTDPEARRVMDYYGASSMDELRTKRRGW